MQTGRDNEELTKVTPYQALMSAIRNHDPITAAAIMQNKPNFWTSYMIDPSEKISDRLIGIAMLSALGKDYECAKVIVANRRADENNEGRYAPALYEAVKMDDVDFVELLLKQGAPTTFRYRDDGTTCLHAALLSKANDSVKNRIIELLVSYGAELDSPDEYITFHLAPDQWSYLIALAERTNRADYNKTRYGRALYEAVGNGDYLVVTRLLKANVNKDWQNWVTRDSCLHKAVSRCDATMTGLLLSFDCDPSIKNKRGETPREMAACVGLAWNRTEMKDTVIRGWQNYCDREESKERNVVTTITQSMGKSGFFKRLSRDIIETHLMPFLHTKFCGEPISLVSTKEHLHETAEKFKRIKEASAKCFLSDYRWHVGPSSEESKGLAADLRLILERDKDCIAQSVQERVKEFLQKNTNPNSRALKLLVKHGLIKILPPEQTPPESKKEERPCTKRKIK